MADQPKAWLSEKLPVEVVPRAPALRVFAVEWDDTLEPPPRREEPVLQYVVVDELEDDVAVLIVEDWPIVDERGRRRFPGRDDRLHVAVSAEALRQLLTHYRETVVDVLRVDAAAVAERPLRVGDAFGAHIDRAIATEAPEHVSHWLRPPLFDVTADAREAAKRQYFAATGPVLAEADVLAMAEEFYADEPETDQPRDRRPPEDLG